jgi:hypothetical protein
MLAPNERYYFLHVRNDTLRFHLSCHEVWARLKPAP